MKVKKNLFILFLLSFQFIANGQDITYTAMDMSDLNRDLNTKDESMLVLYNRNLQFLFDSFAGYYLDDRKAKKEIQQAALKISKLKENFSLRDKFPDSIATGWHNVTLTDNKQFCKEAKVFVSGSIIQQLVIEDCIRIRCTTKGQVKNAKAFVTLNDINSEPEVLDVYFINDLDSTALIEEPMQPGFVCFWTSRNKYLNERLMINGTRRDFISKLHVKEPECLEKGVAFYMLKPGIYNFRATITGNDKESSFEVKPGMCLRYQLK